MTENTNEKCVETKNENKKEEVPYKLSENVNKDYDIPTIPLYELVIYIIFWVITLSSGVYSIHKLSYNKKTLKHFREHGFIVKSYFGLYQSKYEYMWSSLIDLFYKGGLTFTFYLFVSKLLRTFTTPRIFMLGNILLTLGLNYYNSSAKFLGMEILIFLSAAISGVFKLRLLVWINALALLYWFREIADLPFFNSNFLFSNAFSYSALLITRSISIGRTIAQSPKLSIDLFLEMGLYFWYFPAIIGCRMMVIKDFVNNIYKPFVIENWKRWLCGIIRVFIYIIIWDLVTKLVHTYLILATHDIRFFHFIVISGSLLFYGIHYFMVYNILYNSNYLLSLFDGFLTADGPECIAHIHLYSRMWRNFDVAMHLWIKDEIFRPIVKLGPFKITRYFAAVASFLFVVLFHGIRKEHMAWIICNILQYFGEVFLKYIFLSTWVGPYLEKKFSPSTIRKFIVVAGMLSFHSSVWAFAAFQFGMDKANDIFLFSRKENLRWHLERIFIILFFYYGNCQICLSVNEYLRKRKLKTV